MSDNPPPIFVVSGGRGYAANQLLQSLLAQFPENKIAVRIVPQIFSKSQIQEVVAKAKQSGGVVVHTMVDPVAREMLQTACRDQGVRDFDLITELEGYVKSVLGVESVREPGLYRRQHQNYFDRIEALEFTIACDDGLNSKMLSQADIILAGVSRTGKTPLSMYLTMFGWKVANVPIIKDTPVPEQLFDVDAQRVFGLTIACGDLVAHRRKRMRKYFVSEDSEYLDPFQVEDELEYAKSVFRRGHFTVLDVTQKPVETTANEIMALMTERFDISSRLQRS